MSISPTQVLGSSRRVDDKIFASIPKLFARYLVQRFEFVLTTVKTWDPDENSVDVALNGRSTATIFWWPSVVTTPIACLGNWLRRYKKSSTTLNLRTEVDKARSIVVGGGGLTGFGIAGELGHGYAKTGKKEVTRVTTESLPLGVKNLHATRQAARKELEKPNIKIFANARVTKITDNEGRKVVELVKGDGGKQPHEKDLSVPSWSVKSNTPLPSHHYSSHTIG
ncbi:hypothetical protein H2200_003394 [Cladophialophora chaetospira]|uniref:FAD/NAD(P)-binding domain-containing protein n=1 Tax=Cladophialophora chaetospira TaxID=386627 RepID=A0AA38XHD9_9EURO|nr:hypothetical protein H2200_003394 [Cladophialophora chaetospira]